MEGLEGRVFIVTGAARGMGLEHAQLLTRCGARVVLNDNGSNQDGTGTDATLVEQATEAIRQSGGEAVASAADVRTMDGAQEVIDLALSTFGGLHGLVNNAGMLRDKMFVNMSFDDWDAVVSSHLRAMFAPTRLAAAYWRDCSKAGEPVRASVVNISSTSGLIGQVGQSNYGAAKAGVAAATVIIAQELARYGVRVNALTPVARTRMTIDVPGVADLVRQPENPDEFDTFHPRNVSPIVAWLLSDTCKVSGEVFYARGREIRRYNGWQYAETIITDGPWTIEEIGQRLGPICARD